jgi:sensor histidine kinase YesM
MFTFEPMRLGIVVFTTVAIGIGTIVVMLLVYRERAARAEVEAVRAASLQAALERQVLEARLKLMQAQIEPHFLFNTLATVQHLVNTDAALANRVLASLIRYLRAALPDIRGADSTLAREAELVRAYLEIHAVRMGQRLTFNIDIPVEHARAALPPMMLLTLVENAIKHGIDPSPHGGHISMVAVRDDARQEAVSLIVRVADTGVGIGASSASGVGLANIRTRLTALFGQTASLTLAENTPQGVIAELRVPYTVSCEGQTSGGDPRRFTTDR